jgi:hypothetical protein
MPKPHRTVAGQPAWDWVEVESWARRTGRLIRQPIFGGIGTRFRRDNGRGAIEGRFARILR